MIKTANAVLLAFLVGSFLLAGCGNGVETEGEQSVYALAAAGDAGKVREALESGFDVNAPDANGYTILHHAVSGNQALLVELLIVTYHANPLATDSQGGTPVALALQMGNPEVLDVFYNEGLLTY